MTDYIVEEKEFCIEFFPHVVYNISHLWGNQKVIDYMESLLTHDRPYSRGGFPDCAIEEIAFLLEVHKHITPIQISVWDNFQYRR